MTQQYLPEEINQVGYNPVNVNTPGLAPVDFVLGTLTRDGSAMTVQLHGGGFAPTDVAPASHAYVATGNGIAARDAAGVFTVVNLFNTNGPGNPTLALVVVGNNVVIRITPADPTPVNHRIFAITNFL